MEGKWKGKWNGGGGGGGGGGGFYGIFHSLSSCLSAGVSLLFGFGSAWRDLLESSAEPWGLIGAAIFDCIEGRSGAIS